MNKWFYRAVGTVGVAGGFLLLAGGVAQADEAEPSQPTVDPQQLRGLLDAYLTPSGLTPAGLTPAGLTPAGLTPAGGALAGPDANLLGAPPSTDTALPVRNDQLNADPAISMLPPGTLPAGVRPTVQTGSVGTELPIAGPIAVDSKTGQAEVPALIGDAMAAQRADLFDSPLPAESGGSLLGLPVLDELPSVVPAGPALHHGAAGRHAVRPTAPWRPPATGRDAVPAAGRHAVPIGGRHAARPGRHAAPGNQTGTPLRRVAGSPGGRAAERPVAGEDTGLR